ncbi:glycine cleavage T protein (plasmid) [Legionella adelaidensis]|uniref:Glycine cleavage T protein n=1 Tax=Legionella adelaidensis TaxID=45056 RepID=A0A0W0R299_9GAMM|nr:folate-binding protein YgfZ [Legionella adelaidensis]KTC65097.1 glycine cleavage T protein [Legionella adelaidensis]VEH85383.1 glycine cleavage T protein [Legionella adelaidensis]
MHNIQVNERIYTSYTNTVEEFNFLPYKNYLFEIPYLGLINVEGDKSKDFLQGQLSCDLRKVTTEQMQHGALCDLKGRVFALLDVIAPNSQGVTLVLANDLIPATIQTLAKAAAFSRVKLSPANAKIYGFYLQNPNDIFPSLNHFPQQNFAITSDNQHFMYHLGNNFYVIITKEGLDNSKFIEMNQFRGSLAWHVLRLKNHEFQIYPTTKNLFLPHRLDLHLHDYLSFDKGCYKGQEIIARTHYRAKLKHEMKVFTVKTSSPPVLGKRLLAIPDNKDIGEIVDYSPIKEDEYLIATSIIFEHPKKVKIEGNEEEITLT